VTALTFTSARGHNPSALICKFKAERVNHAHGDEFKFTPEMTINSRVTFAFAVIASRAKK
jgi:hypothetical protein